MWVADNLDMRNKSLICEHQRICESYCGKAEHDIALRATDLSWFIFFPQVVINRRRGQFISFWVLLRAAKWRKEILSHRKSYTCQGGFENKELCMFAAFIKMNITGTFPWLLGGKKRARSLWDILERSEYCVSAELNRSVFLTTDFEYSVWALSKWVRMQGATVFWLSLLAQLMTGNVWFQIYSYLCRQSKLIHSVFLLLTSQCCVWK